MTKRLILFACLCVSAFGATLSIPNQSPIGWEPGVDVGIVGGIAAKIAARTTLRDVTASPFSVDRTGVTSVHTAINANIAAEVAHGEVMYFPEGLYLVTSPMALAAKRITVRGAGDGAPSTSSVALGTGTKTFTVASGLGWTAGIGTRVWHAQKPHIWMQGTVTSYSGGTFVMNATSRSGVAITSITRSGTTATATSTNAHGLTTGDTMDISGANEVDYNGSFTVTVTAATTFTFTVANSPATPATGTLVASHGGTHALWIVGQTVFYRNSNNLFFTYNSALDGTTLPAANITGSPVAGATSITIDDATDWAAWFGSGYIYAAIVQLKETDGEEYSHSVDPVTNNQFFNVATISGTTLTLSKPLVVGLPVGRSPKVHPQYIGSYDLGFENFAIFGHTVDQNSLNQNILNLSYLWNSWIYKVQVGIGQSTQVSLSGSIGCEISKSFIGGSGTGTTQSAATIEMSGVGYALVRDNIINDSLIIEGQPCFNNAILRNYAIGYYPTLNHGAGSRFTLAENNRMSIIGFDGYHGGTQQDTSFRNWADGNYDGVTGQVIIQRYSRKHNIVGNVLGKTGATQGAYAFGGLPGNGSSVEPALYVSSGGASGSRFKHVDPSGTSRVVGTLASSGTSPHTATVTLTSYTLAGELTSPDVSGDDPLTLVWDTGYSTKYRQNMKIDRAASSGSSIVLIDGLTGAVGWGGVTKFVAATTAFPSNGTAVRIHMKEYGTQELDLSVEDTAFIKHNYLYGVGGAAGSINDSTTDTLPDSLAEIGRPPDWPSGMTWPVAIHPDSPNIGTAVMPSQVRYLTGAWPEAGPGGSNATVTGTTTVTGTLTLP